MGQMVALIVLVSLSVGGLAPPAETTRPTAIAVVPEEPDAFVLPNGSPTYQALAADLDGDGAREVVRMVGGPESSMLVEAWTEDDGGWREAARTAEVEPSTLPGAGGIGGDPIRLILRSVEGRDRVTVVRQPLRDEPGVDEPCCLLLDDLVVVDGALALRPVATPDNAVETLHTIDFDGDGTDELLTTRSIPPLGIDTFPAEARVFRWTGDAFARPSVTELPIGSGDMPFVLGDSDGRPGDEAAIVSTLGTPALYRVTLGAGDRIELESAGLVVADAVAVPVGDGRGIAIISPTDGLEVHTWPAGEALGPTVAEQPIGRARFLGVVTIEGRPSLLVQRAEPDALHVLNLPGLTPPRGNAVTRSPAAAGFATAPVHSYVGALPGGGLDGEPAVIFAGRLLPSEDLPGAPFATFGAALMASMPGAEPIGLVGRGRGWMAIVHNPLSLERLEPTGGFVASRVAQPVEAVSIAPLAAVRTPEVDDGSVEPAVVAAHPLDDGELAVGPGGFVATVQAPVGSRVYVTDANGMAVGRVVTIDGNGRESAIVPVPDGAENGSRFRASLSVVTPAGHGYVARFDARLLEGAPPLEATAVTPLGSAVEVSGRTAPYATVTVAGEDVDVADDGAFSVTVDAPPWPTDVQVAATDPLGNGARESLRVIGLFDYRGLPWIPIVGGLVALAAVVLLLRVPHANPFRRAEGDDAVLEELESD